MKKIKELYTFLKTKEGKQLLKTIAGVIILLIVIDQDNIIIKTIEKIIE